MLLDAETFDLVQHIDTVLAAVAGHELEPVINAELMQSVLEIATPVCHTTGEVADQLRKIRGYVCSVARDQGLRVGSAGTHPFSLFERQRITARDRYRSLVDQMQYVARRELTVLAGRADGPALQPADDLRRLPALGAAAAIRELCRLCRGRRPTREDRL